MASKSLWEHYWNRNKGSERKQIMINIVLKCLSVLLPIISGKFGVFAQREVEVVQKLMKSHTIRNKGKWALCLVSMKA
jgi:hypothetical protein